MTKSEVTKGLKYDEHHMTARDMISARVKKDKLVSRTTRVKPRREKVCSSKDQPKKST